MLVNVYRHKLATIPGTRMLVDTLGIVGAQIYDADTASRTWEVRGLLAPLVGRAVGGIRAKLEDQKGFVTFCNQRDLEVLLGLAQPGQYCEWTDRPYLGSDDPEWFGLCSDDDDLLDDLQERELFCRAQYPEGVLYPPLDISRRVHRGSERDFEELLVLIDDVDLDTGVSPDSRLETIERRWKLSERRHVRWEHTRL